MAQIARAPDRKINQYASVVSVGVIIVTKYATIPPIIKVRRIEKFHLTAFFETKMAEAIIKPKKKDQISTGLLSRIYFKILAKENTLIKIPTNTANKKFPFMDIQKSLIPFLNSCFKEEKLIDFIELINSSYMPEINAIVPPDTPGTTSAAPIPTPFRVTRR